MRIRDFFPAKSQTVAAGLGSIEMPRLGQVVVLAGRNGAGKTRVLKVLSDTIDRLSQWWAYDDATIASQLQLYSMQLKKSLPQSTIDATRNIVEQLESVTGIRKKSVFLGQPQSANVVDFVPSSDGISDPSVLSKAKLAAGYVQIISTLGMKEVNGSVHAYIDHVASLHYNASHPETVVVDHEERSRCMSAWISLKAIVEILLPGASLGRSVGGDILIFGRTIAMCGLSDGQRALLRVAIALHAQSARLDEAIVLLDEPENHLHPDALVEFVDRLIRSLPNGQIWIATHSVHVLSHVEPESLWFVEEGKISWAGRQSERVLRSLVGDEERVGRLERFIHLPSVLAMERFAAECLLPPAIVITGAEDRQSNQIYKNIARRPEGAILRVLDFGAGRGRILATLRQKIADLPSHVDYRAFELNPDARSDCADALADAYGLDREKAKDRVYESEDALRRKLNRHSVDVVVMCNVLHEIHPSEWRRIFTEQIISYCLKPDGYLLLLEDMRIPYGENAHKHGFVLLDTEQLQTLFAVDRENPSQFIADSADSEGRLKAHLIRADALKQVTDERVKEALERRMDSAGELIQKLRSSPATYANGHLLALYTMIYANAALALKS